MKTFLLLFCVPVFFTVSGQAKFSRKCLTISQSTVQSWSPGNVQVDGKTAGGVIYQIKAVLKKSGQLKFDSLFLDGKNLALEVVKGTDRGYAGALKKGDSITLQTRQDKGVTYQQNSSGITRLISSKKDAVAFISIWINGKRYLHPVSEFKKTSSKDVNR